MMDGEWMEVYNGGWMEMEVYKYTFDLELSCEPCTGMEQ